MPKSPLLSAVVIAISLVATGAAAKTKRPAVPAVSVVPVLPPAVVAQIRPIVVEAISEIKPIVAAARVEDRPLTPAEIGVIRDVRADTRDAINDVLVTNNLPVLPERPTRPQRPNAN